MRIREAAQAQAAPATPKRGSSSAAVPIMVIRPRSVVDQRCQTSTGHQQKRVADTESDDDEKCHREDLHQASPVGEIIAEQLEDGRSAERQADEHRPQQRDIPRRHRVKYVFCLLVAALHKVGAQVGSHRLACCEHHELTGDYQPVGGSVQTGLGFVQNVRDKQQVEPLERRGEQIGDSPWCGEPPVLGPTERLRRFDDSAQSTSKPDRDGNEGDDGSAAPGHSEPVGGGGATRITAATRMSWATGRTI